MSVSSVNAKARQVAADSKIDAKDVTELFRTALADDRGRVTDAEIGALADIEEDYAKVFNSAGARLITLLLEVEDEGLFIEYEDIRRVTAEFDGFSAPRARNAQAATWLLENYGDNMSDEAIEELERYANDRRRPPPPPPPPPPEGDLEDAIAEAKEDRVVDLNEMVGFFDLAGVGDLDAEELELINEVIREAGGRYRVTQAASGGADLMKAHEMGETSISKYQGEELVEDIENSSRRSADRRGAAEMLELYDFDGRGVGIIEDYLDR
jgi:hypothetical protein